jgi:hypothetical protein
MIVSTTHRRRSPGVRPYLRRVNTVSHTSSAGCSSHISQYWHAESVPSEVATLLNTFREQNPDLVHEVFDEAGARALIRSSLSMREVGAFDACAVPAMQADFFRYCAVLKLGGVYSDADYRCVSSLRPLIGGDSCGELFCRPETYVLDGQPLRRVLNGFFVFSEPGHPLLELAIDVATANVEQRIGERVWGVGENVKENIWMSVGPGIFTTLHYLNVLGSFDRLIRVTAGTPAEHFMDLYCEVIGTPDRVTAAFDGVRVSPFEEMWRWIAHPEAPLPYKGTGIHWKNVTTPIFKRLH